MSNELDSAKLNDIIQQATQEMVNRTEAFIQSTEGNSAGTDTISIMVNGEKTILSRDDYALLKAETEAIKLKRKADIKDLTNKIKASIKDELKEHKKAEKEQSV